MVTKLLLDEVKASLYHKDEGESLRTCAHGAANTEGSTHLCCSVVAATLTSWVVMKDKQTSHKAKSGLYDGKYMFCVVPQYKTMPVSTQSPSSRS